MPKFEVLKGSDAGMAISQEAKTLLISSGKEARGELKLTNQYGNSASFALDERGFDELWSMLWEFVKERQH